MSAGPPHHLRFGVFIAPFHEPGQDPTLAIERDLELIQHVDRLGFHEAWVGEHHSTGWETIASPELFLAVAAERTKHIRLGTGAVSLPYHHPLMVADRICLLDHLTRGRINFGVGPGGHLTDAVMLGLDIDRLRPEMAERLDLILRLMTTSDPVTHVSEGYELRDAVLQLRPYQRPHPPLAVTSMESPAGMQVAGRLGCGVLSLTVAKGPKGPVDLSAHWAIAEEEADRHGTVVDRADWRLSTPVHIAETRREAFDAAREGAATYLLDYAEAVTGRPSPVPGPRAKIVEQMVEAGSWIVGTPDDLIAAIERLKERSGGFGTLLLWAHEWAPRAAVLRSYELIAREVMPRFTGALEGIEASNAMARRAVEGLHTRRQAAVEKARRDYEASRRTD